MTNLLPERHILPVDVTIEGAGVTDAQNRIALHLHGGFVPWMSDGGPFDWWTPSGESGLSFINGPDSELDNIPGQKMKPGQADYWYPNDQSFRLMWYHDHAHGITRLNAYAGLATGYLLLDTINQQYVHDGKIPGLTSTIPLVVQDKKFVSTTTQLTDPTWTAVTDPKVHGIGSLWYEHVYDPKEFKLLKGGAYLPPPNPSCVAEYFGDTVLCNGTAYPLLEVDAKRYRFLMLNACNSRFLNLNLFQANMKNVDGIDLDPKLLFPLNRPGPNMVQIGNECGFLVKEVTHVSPKPFNPLTLTGNLILAPAERADVIIDFTGLEGKEFIVYNDCPGPFPGGNPAYDYFLGNPLNPIQPVTIRNKTTGQKWSTGPDTRQVLRIKVKVTTPAIPDPQPVGPIVDAAEIDPALLAPIPANWAGEPLVPVVTVDAERDLSLNEEFDTHGRLTQTMGTLTPLVTGGLGRPYLAPPTEVPNAGAVEVWHVWNLSADTHPIHLHLVNAQILQRQAFSGNGANQPLTLIGQPRGPEANELGWKETIQMHPFEVTTLIMKFDLPATPFTVPSSPRAATYDMNEENTTYHEYVYHCHILEHEEHDMMRPLCVKSTNPTP
jgi:spore coat protein A